MRYAAFRGLDTPLAMDGDNGFMGLNMKDPADQLKPGVLQRSTNKRLRRGIAETRPGTFEPGYANSLQFGPPFTGSGIYSNPNKDELLMIAEQGASYVWAIQEGHKPRQIPLTGITGSTGKADIAGGPETIPLASGETRFVQAFDKLILLRSNQEEPLQWNGFSPDGFLFFDPAADGFAGDPSVAPIPSVWNGEPFQGTILYSQNVKSDRFFMSMTGAYSVYDNVFGEFRINAGQADSIVRILAFSRESVIIFMHRSIHSLSNFTVDPLLARQEQLQDNIGLAGPSALVQIGAEVYFLSRSTGIYALSQVDEHHIAAGPVPISDAIQPIIERINWGRAWFSSAASLGDYAYFAVPLEDDKFPTTVLVLNTVTKQWESIDTWADHDVTIDKLHVTNYNKSRRLFAVNYQRGRVYVLEEGTADITTEIAWPIYDSMQTRGYGGGGGSIKRFSRVRVPIRTRTPNATFKAVTDGVNEEKLLTPTPITKNNLANYMFSEGVFDPFTEDVDQPWREDYSQDGLGFAWQDFESLPEMPLSAEDFLPRTPPSPVVNVAANQLEPKL